MNKVILLVDDSPDDCEILRRTLREAGVENPLRAVESGEQAIAYLKGEDAYADRQRYPFPNVLFLDLAMSRMDGWEVLRWIHSQHFPIETLVTFVLTGAVGMNRLQEAYALGANSFLVKPLKAADVQGLIRYWPAVWMLKDKFPSLPAGPTDEARPASQTL